MFAGQKHNSGTNNSGHQRAGALTDSIKIIQHKIFTLYLVKQLHKILKTEELVFRSNRRGNSSQLSGELDRKTQKDRK